MHIQNGRGVCGTALKQQSTLRVANVHEFPDHIACDSASNSEIVIPLMVEKQPIGVLDIDSPSLNRFSATDEQVLNDFVATLMKHIDKSVLRALN
jgi:GAF domain-containing protein